MTKAISKRVVTDRFLRRIVRREKNSFISRELCKSADEHIASRGFPIAVFGNDWIGTNVFLHGVYEKESIEDFISLLISLGIDLPKARIADIGANIGNHAIQFSKHFEKVFAFEPNPRVYDVLVCNTKRVSNIETFNFGCGRVKATAKLNEVFNNIGGSSVVIDETSNSSFDIQIIPFDEMLEAVGQVDAIKIDVEGMELDVLKGAEKIIVANKPVICLEQHESEFYNDFNETAALDWLRLHGFKIFALERKTKKPWLRRRLKNISQLFFGYEEERVIVEYEKLPKATYANVYAVHESRISLWIQKNI